MIVAQVVANTLINLFLRVGAAGLCNMLS